MSDVATATAFYASVLGFRVDYANGDPMQYAVVARDDVFIHLSHSEPPDFLPGNGRAFVAVQGVEAIWEQVQAVNPGAITTSLQDCDYGMGVRFKVFAVADPDGNALRIGEPRGGTA